MWTMLRVIIAYRNYLIAWLTPLLFLALPLAVPSKEAQCGYTIILMALLWCTEALPLAVTGLLPVMLFPLMGIMDSTKVCMEYLKDTNMLFIGGLLVAIAVERWNLHKRIALRVLLIIGVRPALLMMGFMGVTAFLSMWISNTATTAMMVPIAHAVLQQLHKSEQEMITAEQASVESGKVNGGFELQETAHPSANGTVVTMEKEKKLVILQELEQKYQTFCKGISLAVCYSSSIGGIATLTGTTPNLVLKGQMDELFPYNGNVVNFASWFSFAFPTMIVLLVLSWLWLLFMFLGFDFRKNFGCGSTESEKSKSKVAYDIIRNEHRGLGPMKCSEITILALFIILVLLWFTREPGFMPGWATLFNRDGKSYVTDATVVIFIGLLLFLIPSEMPRCCFRGRAQQGGRAAQIQAPEALLDWQTVNRKMPWNIVLLLGGGFALAKGSEASGLSKWLGSKLTPLQSIPYPAITFLICLLIAVFTECTSNVATTTLFLPILASLSQAICLNPLYVMLPCTLSSSLAFMLPVATPPNAIVFSYGQLKVIDMVKAGCMLNLLGVLSITLAINTWAFPLFDLSNFPVWANSTSSAHC
ncbi:solute carrier family 13 member 2 [Eublepharis macularius]|uniref:Solute carrier family 13 member 2 n=1 Tax=Eublepharis macularius TaxID=481883 RepID=A0AA97LIA5_EUBMA|nr:solute carrier family 13 member 2 [Eublepharis macularius]